MESSHEPGEDTPADELIDKTDPLPHRPTMFHRGGPGRQDGRDPLPQDDAPDGDGDDSIAQALSNVAATLEADPPRESEPHSLSYPAQPRTLAEVGLSKAFLTDLALKIIHYSGSPSAAQIMRRMGLSQTIVQQLLSSLQEERLCEVLSQSDLFTGNYRYRLSERGAARAAEALERTRYAGPVPVTAEQYTEVIRAQQARRQTTSRTHIKALLDELILAPEVVDAVARALFSGKTMMLHGLSGNGKTSILERFARGLEGAALVPNAIYAYGQVIRVFDPSIHEPIEDPGELTTGKDDGKVDRRWVLVRRPAVILGSEIGAETLDLAYDPQARFYQAPAHIKAQGGVLLVDDLGRQRIGPVDLMTRWLIASERGWDSLALITGEKLTIPFNVQLLFGTNRPLADLADDALLRRVLYKIEIPSPTLREFTELLRRLCRQRNVRTQEGAIERVSERLYSESGLSPRASYARDLLEVVVEGAAYDEREPVLDDESLERALGLFTSQSDRD